MVGDLDSNRWDEGGFGRLLLKRPQRETNVSLEHIRAKLARLDQLGTRLGDDRVEQLAAAAAATLADAPAFLTATATFKSCLMLDAVYALARHRLWVNNNLFITALVDFLSSEYRLAESTVRELLSALAPAAAALAHRGATEPGVALADTDDRDFLRYVFVASATAADEGALIADLGLGTRLLRRVRQSVETAAAPGATYLAPLDADVAAVMAELAKDTQDSRWALDVQRLRFEVWEAGVPLPTAAEANTLFDLLLTVGRKRRVKEAKVEHGDERSALRRAGMIFMVDGALELAPKGQALTAAAFAAGAEGQKELTLETLAALNAHYQERVIATHPALGPRRLVGLVRDLRPLAPLGLRAAIARVARDPSPGIREELLSALAGAALPPWLEAAAEAALRDAGIAPGPAPVARSRGAGA